MLTAHDGENLIARLELKSHWDGERLNWSWMLYILHSREIEQWVGIKIVIHVFELVSKSILQLQKSEHKWEKQSPKLWVAGFS